VADIPLPGPPVRFDYQSVDTTSDRLYISHMDAGEVLVFDLKTRRVIATIRDLPRVTGICAVPALGKVFASVSAREEVAVIDARTLRVSRRVGHVGFPDGIAYAPDQRKVYVSDEASGGELVIDAATDRVVTTIPLGGEAGNTIYDPGSKRIFVALQSRNEIAVLDPASDLVVARYPIPGAAHPHGLALDAADRVLFIANQDGGTLMAFDLRSLRVTGAAPVGESPDVLAYDPEWGLLYVASESGRVSVLAERDGILSPAGEIHAPHAHTVAVDPRSHLVYLPLQEIGGHPVLRILERPRPAGGP
jgi:YVTN family beta-propeller protein